MPQSLEPPASTSLMELPDNVLLSVYSFLNTTSCLRLGATCKRAEQLSHEDTLLWKPRCA